ncbi:tensin-4 [Emydura macquarii macquarii]|uniref:tensin-4 n=1 Tax=Emydura macquarii macquarii TaxID=1129001 RepID=UPI00352B0D29
MSQVIPNHVLRVGQTVRIASQEESRNLHPAGCPCCSVLTTKYSYYSAEGWLSQPMMAQTKAHLLPNGRPYGPTSTAVFTRTTSPAPEKEHPVTSLERPRPTHQPRGEDGTEVNPDACPASPTLDVSIESLNQLILEIDPTFQPLPVIPDGSKKRTVQTTSPGNVAETEKQDPDALDIKYIEMTPTRAKSHESMQGSASPCSTPLSTSPQGRCLLFPRGVAAQDNCPTNDSLVFSSPSGPNGNQAVLQTQPPAGSSPQSCYRVSESVSIPQCGQKDCISYGPNTRLSSSPGLENLRKPLYVGRAQQRTSRVSMLSMSPGSDTSYVLGSSTQSLLNDDSDSYQGACRSAESPLSVGSFGSPYLTSLSLKADRFGGAVSPGFNQTNVSSSNKANTSSSLPLQKGHASSCPPSIVNSMADIPILLVNGCLEPGETSPRLAKGFQGSIKQTVPPNSSPSSGTSSLNKTSSDTSLLFSLDSPSKDGQPTMKFVMDTSKYWFKPSITRDQAIQLLKEAEPGAFIVRDSTSYRGSFGLAMKVLISPSSCKTGDDSGDLIRHFLIESSAKGVHLKGASEEPYFGSLSAFVYQHVIMPLALPCRLAIPTRDFTGGENSSETLLESALSAMKKTAVCNVLYLNSVSVETLTGASAVQKAVSSTFELETLPTPTIVHFKVTEQGITLTDVQRKVFFRRHYPLATLSFCSMDPENRKWQKYCKSSRIFGFIAKSQMDTENLCHLFAEYDTVQPASLVIDFISKLLPEQ